MATVTLKAHLNLYVGGSTGPENPTNWSISYCASNSKDWMHVKELELTFEHEVTKDSVIPYRVSALRASREKIVAKFTEELSAVDTQIAELTAIENSNA